MKLGAKRMPISAEAIGDPPPVALRDVSPAVDSVHPCVAGGSQDGNLGQSTASNKDIRVVRKQVRHSVVQTDPPPQAPKPCNIKQKRRRQIDIEERNESSRWVYHPFGKWSRPWLTRKEYIDFYVGANGQASVKYLVGHLYARIGLEAALRRSLLFVRLRLGLSSCPRLVLTECQSIFQWRLALQVLMVHRGMFR